MSPDEPAELTAAAIARLAGVGRAAVSNWRKRYPGFPKPVGGSESSPTFSRVEVEAWLKETGKADQLATAGRTATGTQALDSALASPGGDRDDMASLVARTEPEPAAADLTSGQLMAKVMVSLLPELPESPNVDDTNDATAPAVLDPACGKGTLLMAVADRFGDQVRLVGQEIRESAATAAALNLRGDPQSTPYEIHVGDSLLDNRLREHLGTAVAVVCEPPFDLPSWPAEELAADPRWAFGTPGPRDAELAWVQHAYAHLRPKGVAVVAVSPRTGVQPTGRHIRSELVRSGALRDVIALPKGLGSLPDVESHLWVLQRPHGPAPGDVRMVDLSGMNAAGDVPYEAAAWEQLFDNADPTIIRAVPRDELLDGDSELLPSRHMAVRAEVSADDLACISNRLSTLYTQIGQGLPTFTASRRQATHPMVTLGELERSGALRIRSRDTTPRQGDLLLRTLGRPPIVATGTDVDDLGVAQVVELDTNRLDPHFVATFLRTDAAALPVANTLGALSRDDLRRCRIPRMTPAEQRRYGDAFRRLDELAGFLSALAKVSTNVIAQTVHGLTTGALSPDPPNATHTTSPAASESETNKP